MRIKKLELYNFGIYSKTNLFEFSNDKPIILIGGMNGRGKTTLLEAILLALYGKRSFAISDSKLSFTDYLAKFINKSDGTKQANIQLSFDLSVKDEQNDYIVSRCWHFDNDKLIFNTIAQKNNQYDKTLSENWDIFIEDILPSAIAPFFFFDGEKISEIANSDNDIHMKNSIKSLLGIDVVDQSIADIKKVIANNKRAIKNDIFSIEVKKYEHQLKEIEKEIRETIAESGLLEIRKKKISDQLRETENKFSVIGGSFASYRKELQTSQSIIIDRLEKVHSQIQDLASGDLPLLMVETLLTDIHTASEYERKSKAIQTTSAQLPSMFNKYCKDKNIDTNISIDDFITYMKSYINDTKASYSLSDIGFLKVASLCSTLLDIIKDNAVLLLEKRQELLDEKDKVENYLSIDIDESEVESIYNKILELTSELATVSEQYRIAKENENLKRAYYDELERQHHKLIEKAVSILEEADEAKRILTYSEYSLNVLNTYKVRLQEEKAKQLAEIMTSCLKHIIVKQNLISEIKIDPISLNFIYLDINNNPINMATFSAGEKQLIVIAMLWALGICSNKKLPVVIDTPLARLDSSHRKTLIANYFPNASDQTILLSTDREIYGDYYKLIKPYVDKEYTLQYDDATRCTIINEGYFSEVTTND